MRPKPVFALATLCVLATSCAPKDASHPDAEAADTAPASTLPAAHFDTVAVRLVEFLRGRRPLEDASDSVTLYVVPEGGGGRRTLRGTELRDPRKWTVRSGSTTYTFVPPQTFTNMTSKFGSHFQCMERSLGSRMPTLAHLPHVGVKLEPPRASSCLQSWNVTFVFDAPASHLVAAVYDQWEW